MREYLFRGKRIDNGEWVKGFFVNVGGYCYILTGKLSIANGYIEFVKHEVIPETVGQYTGLTDKNGVKIFEGDIVRYYGTYALEVFIENGHTKIRWFDTVTNRIETDLFFCYDAEVYGECEGIGNIHDNPELLKEGAK